MESRLSPQVFSTLHFNPFFSVGHVCPHKKHEDDDIVTNVVSRPRKSPYPMITVDEAQKIVIEHCKTIGHQIETVSFKQALHRVLAVDIKAKDPLPPFPGKILDFVLQGVLVLLNKVYLDRSYFFKNTDSKKYWESTSEILGL